MSHTEQHSAATPRGVVRAILAVEQRAAKHTKEEPLRVRAHVVHKPRSRKAIIAIAVMVACVAIGGFVGHFLWTVKL